MDLIISNQLSGFWTYEFCINNKIRQFHISEDGKDRKEYILGTYADSSGTIQVQNGTIISRYVSMEWKDGTFCDLTNTPRETLVEVNDF